MNMSAFPSKKEYIDNSTRNVLAASCDAKKTGGRETCGQGWDNPIFLDSTAISSPSPWQIHRGSQTTSVIEGLSRSAPVDKEKFNYDGNFSTANFEFEASYQFGDLWDDVLEYSQSSGVPVSSGQFSATVETPASINSTKATTTTTVCSSGHSSTVPSINSKRQHSSGHYDEDSGRRKRRSDNVTEGIDQEQSKFACPFRKHDPARYGIQRGWRICALSRWESIARVKEHLYRCHMAPPLCQRCKATFKNREDLDIHMRELIACEYKATDLPEGITPIQMQTLKSRKRVKRSQSERERWEEIYRILFPEAIELPHPYFEPIQEEPAHAILNDYEEFSQKAMSETFRTKLDTEYPFRTLDTDLKDNLMSLMKFCHASTLEMYRYESGIDPAATTSLAKPKPPSQSPGPVCSSTPTAAYSTAWPPEYLDMDDPFTVNFWP